MKTASEIVAAIRGYLETCTNEQEIAYLTQRANDLEELGMPFLTEFFVGDSYQARGGQLWASSQEEAEMFLEHRKKTERILGYSVYPHDPEWLLEFID